MLAPTTSETRGAMATLAPPVTTPMELFIAVVKLSVVERLERRRLKAHFKTHLIHDYHFNINFMCQVKVRSNITMKRYLILGIRVD